MTKHIKEQNKNNLINITFPLCRKALFVVMDIGEDGIHIHIKYM